MKRPQESHAWHNKELGDDHDIVVVAEEEHVEVIDGTITGLEKLSSSKKSNHGRGGCGLKRRRREENRRGWMSMGKHEGEKRNSGGGG